MNEDSYLDPDAIRQQSVSALWQLGEDSTALKTALEYISRFIENDEIQSESFQVLKQQMEAYRCVVKALLEAIQQDAEDHSTLQREVGYEILSGADILRQKQLAETEMEQERQMIAYCKTQMRAYADHLLTYEHYAWLLAKYEYMLTLDEELYRYCQGKEAQYDEIESRTAGLFQRGKEIRTIAVIAMEELGKAFQGGKYTSPPFGMWQTALGCGEERKTLSEAGGLYKQQVVEGFETVHPEIAERFNRLLQSKGCEELTMGDILNIKYLAYTAEEPYRSLYLEKLDAYWISDLYGEDEEKNMDTFYGVGRHITLNYPESFLQDKRGAYTSFFHETGHGTDYYMVSFFSHRYQYEDPETGEKHSLYELIEADVYENVREHIRACDASLTEEEVEQVLQSIQYGGSEEDLQDVKLEKIRDDVLRMYDTELAGPTMSAVCDVYGGITNQNISSAQGYGHGPEEGKPFLYWYDVVGQPTNKQSSELWTEYFSYQMTGNEEALEQIRAYYPRASEAMDAMTEEMARRTVR
ncbi:MAG: hypothetical protein NC089_12680 [Bacteroides sp.]|nr:hypothetical protein [Bacteroides sp.]MCM1550933.1 hypothetical protein [Clostridium sp.]